VESEKDQQADEQYGHDRNPGWQIRRV